MNLFDKLLNKAVQYIGKTIDSNPMLEKQIKELAKNPDIVKMSAQLSGASFEMVHIFCNTCDKRFDTKTWVAHMEEFKNAAQKNQHEQWKISTFEHYLDNPDHEIIIMGLEHGNGWYNLTEEYNRKILTIPQGKERELLQRFKDHVYRGGP